MKRRKYSLSHYKILSGLMGKLIPITWYETLPGDTIQQTTAAMIRMAPLVAPLMHPIRVRIHHWFVPYRLIWEDTEDFFTGGEDGTSAPSHPVISLNATTVSEGSLYDYLGIPDFDFTGTQQDVNALPFRAYNLIYNEHYRDQQLVTAKTIDLTSGTDTTTDTDLLDISWEKDYFTTSRTSADLGDAVSIPIESSGEDIYLTATGAANQRPQGMSVDGNLELPSHPSSNSYLKFGTTSTGLQVDIDELRAALALRRFQEIRNMFGSRYTEYLRFLGVKSSDARLQNPEFLGGGSAPVQISEVLNVGQQDGSNDIGDMYGHGIAGNRTRRFRRFFEEHGLVMSLLSVQPKAIYESGLHRSWLREDREDYHNKELEMIGEQAVMGTEVYAKMTGGNDSIWGYQQKYEEYRSHPSSIAGKFRTSNHTWHLARAFASDQTLNSSWIACSPKTTVFADSSGDQFYVMANHSIQARRLVGDQKLSKTI